MPSKCDLFWMTPLGLKTLYFFLVLNILGLIGWIAGAIYVTAAGHNDKLWFWAMPWGHPVGIWGCYRGIKENKKGPLNAISKAVSA